MPQLSARNEVIDDPTDPGGTLRPNLPPEPTTGTEFKPLSHPEFDYKINLPSYVDATNPIAIWDLFYTPEQMQILVQNTNRNGLYWHRIGPRNSRALEWQDITVEELYAYFAILIYMGLHIENEIEEYWSTDSDNVPTHLPVRRAMVRDRFKQISSAFHISDKGSSVFLKVQDVLLIELIGGAIEFLGTSTVPEILDTWS
jgi:hypothetical protein